MTFVFLTSTFSTPFGLKIVSYRIIKDSEKKTCEVVLESKRNAKAQHSAHTFLSILALVVVKEHKWGNAYRKHNFQHLWVIFFLINTLLIQCSQIVSLGSTFKIHHCIFFTSSYKQSLISVEDKIVLGVIVTTEHWNIFNLSGGDWNLHAT